MSILKNAVDSIAIGLEDYTSPDERRVVSCTRNVFAGILLLFKYKLSMLSGDDTDEVLIKQKILPKMTSPSKMEWVGQGKKTVDVQGIKERFESLNIGVDWKRIDKINNFRNEIEHYYTKLSHDTIRSLISDSFIIINDFIKAHLAEDPKALLGEVAWNTLVDVNEVFQSESSACSDALSSLLFFDSDILIAFIEYSCDDCASTLTIPVEVDSFASEVDYVCKNCNKCWSYTELVDAAVKDYFFNECYLAHTKGGDFPYDDCDECGGVYLNDAGICATCGQS